MTEQAVDTGYRTVAELAEHLGVSVFTVYRNVKAGVWKGSRTSNTPRASIRFSPTQVAAIEQQMADNGNPEPVAVVASRAELDARLDHGMRRRMKR